MKTVSGFDIGGTKVLSACLIDDQIKLEEKSPTPTSYNEIVDYIYSRLVEHQKVSTISSVGIGIAGAFDNCGCLWCPNIPSLSGKPLLETLKKAFPADYYIENDAQAALRGEIWKGTLCNSKNAALITIGTGIGAAFNIDGTILTGRHGAAGACGWILTKDSNGKTAHFEELASGRGLHNLAKEIGLDSYGLIAAYKSGNIEAQKLFHLWSQYLADGIASIVSIFDLDIIAIGGGLSENYELFEPTIKEHIMRYASPLVKDTKIIRATLGEKATLYGALSLASQK